jgi:uncharacterized protein (TIGR02001 family)
MKGKLMRKMISKFVAVPALLSSIAVATPAFAQDEEKEASGPVDVEVTLTAVSDYRFRGVSLSDKDPAFQPGINVSHESGIYVGAWASNVADNGGDDIEIDIFAGFSGGEALTYDIGITSYLYPGASSLNYSEVIGKLGTTVGPLELGGTLAYAPSQDGTGNEDNVYVGGNASFGIPNTPLKLNAALGLEDGAFGDNKLDWSLGVTADISGFTVGASYVDTNRRLGGLGKAGAVFSISYAF